LDLLLLVWDFYENPIQRKTKSIIRLNFILTKGCFVSQCLKTFKTLIVDAVLTIVYSFVFCSFELDAKGFPLVVGCGVAELPP